MTVYATIESARSRLVRTRVIAHDGPFALRYPRDATPDSVPAMSEIEPVPYGTWDVVRRGSDLAILATGTMVLPCVEAANTLAPSGIDVTVVNCRFLKPYDALTLAGIIADHKRCWGREGSVVNGFGALMARVDPAARLQPFARPACVPDCFSSRRR